MPESLEETSGHLCDCLPCRYGLICLFRMSLLGMQPEGIELGNTQGLAARAVQS